MNIFLAVRIVGFRATTNTTKLLPAAPKTINVLYNAINIKNAWSLIRRRFISETTPSTLVIFPSILGPEMKRKVDNKIKMNIK